MSNIFQNLKKNNNFEFNLYKACTIIGDFVIYFEMLLGVWGTY